MNPIESAAAAETEAVDDAAATELVDFWELARQHVGLDRLDVITGPDSAGKVPPPAFAFGDTPELADEALALVLAGTKRATSSAVSEYASQGEEIPAVGDLSIVLDGRGHPRVLVRTTAVEVVAFGAVDAEHALLEGEGDLSLEAWRSAQRAFAGRAATAGADAAGVALDDATPLVLERFEVRFPARD